MHFLKILLRMRMGILKTRHLYSSHMLGLLTTLVVSLTMMHHQLSLQPQPSFLLLWLNWMLLLLQLLHWHETL